MSSCRRHSGAPCCFSMVSPNPSEEKRGEGRREKESKHFGRLPAFLFRISTIRITHRVILRMLPPARDSILFAGGTKRIAHPSSLSRIGFISPPLFALLLTPLSASSFPLLVCREGSLKGVVSSSAPFLFLRESSSSSEFSSFLSPLSQESRPLSRFRSHETARRFREISLRRRDISDLSYLRDGDCARRCLLTQALIRETTARFDQKAIPTVSLASISAIHSLQLYEGLGRLY